MSFSQIPTQPRSAATADAPEWAGMTFLRAGAELVLGLSFFVAMAFGAYGALVHQQSIVAELASIAFVCSMVCVLVNWFTATTTDEDRRGWE